MRVHTFDPVPEDKRDALVKSLSLVTANSIGKPETYVMVTLSSGTVCMGGDVAPGAFVDVRSIGGLSGTVNKSISEQVCEILGTELDIPGDRIYLNFTDVSRADWGWNGATFG
jgi:phenylpyruvate tautomerase